MYHIDENVIKKANRAAVYNLYLYLAHINTPPQNTSFDTAIEGLKAGLWSKKRLCSEQQGHISLKGFK